MAQYIDKSALVAEIEKIREQVKRLRYAVDANCMVTVRNTCECLELSIDLLVNSIDTLEVKEVYECNDVDLNPLFEEMGVEPDSRIALMFKNAFYKSVDNYLDKKED